MQLLKHDKNIRENLLIVTTKQTKTRCPVFYPAVVPVPWLLPLSKRHSLGSNVRYFISVDLAWLFYQVGFVIVAVCFFASFCANIIIVIHVSISLV